MGKGKTRRQLLSLAFGRSTDSFDEKAEERDAPSSETVAEGPPPRRLARIDSPRCIALTSFCSVCSERCPVEGAIVLVRNQPRIVAERCDGCAICAEVCPAPLQAISMLELPPEAEA